MKNFRSHDLAVAFYREARSLRLPAHLKDQMMRAASSIALNLREGSGRRTPRDQARFFSIAFASAKEVQAVLDLEVDPTHILVNQADVLAAHIYRLHQVCVR